jgi:enterochelin esterase-like enzyme
MSPSTPPRSRRLAIQELIGREEEVSPEEVAAFVERHTFPVVEGRYCTFAFQGDADAVALRHWIYGLPSSQPFGRLPGTDLWFLVLEIPEGSRVEYKLEVTVGGETHLVEDPLNPLQAHDPFGANSVCHAQGYRVPDWTLPDPAAPEGALREMGIESRALGGPRRIAVYLPARFRRTRRHPLLVVHDGPDYLRYSALRTVLDNLIHRHEIPPIVAALIHPMDRIREYTAFDPHVTFLTEELVPTLERRLPLLGDAEGRGLVGASLGAGASLHAAASKPGFFGRLLLQSGSFAFSDIGEHTRGPALDPVAAFVNAFRSEPHTVSRRVFVSCGIYESLIYENRSLVPALQDGGMDVRFVEARDGHNWENWRDRLREGLSWLFPGPLWMYYE